MKIIKSKLNPGIIVRKEKELGIVFDANKNKGEFYNDTGIEILSLIENGYELSQIVDILEKSYNSERKQIEKDLIDFISEQSEKGFISCEE